MPDFRIGRAVNTDYMYRMTRYQLSVFTDWLAQFDAKGMLGEIGWPSQAYNVDWDAWNAIGDYALQQAENLGLWIAGWSSATGFPTAMAVYLGSAGGNNPDLNLLDTQALTFEKYGNKTRRGLATDGNSTLTNPALPDDFFAVSPKSGSRYYGGSSVSLGVLNTDYFYPSQNSLNFLRSRGYTFIRLPVRWERLAHTPGGVLDATEIVNLDNAIARIGTAGMQAIIDLHNWHSYSVFSGQTFTTTPAITGSTVAQTVAVSATPSDLGVGSIISIDTAGNQEFVKITAFVAATSITGIFTKSHTAVKTATIQGVYRTVGDASGLVTQAHFTDIWTKLATRYSANANVMGYELMNEPIVAPATWETHSNAAIAAIRAVPDTKTIFIQSGNNYAAPSTWATSHPANWVVDTAANYRFVCHYYWGQQINLTNANFVTSYKFSERLARINAAAGLWL